MKRIVVGLDGSHGAANALRWVARLCGASVEIITMTGLAADDADLASASIDDLLDEQERRLRLWSDAAGVDGVPVRVVVEPGDPRPGILRVAEREQADMVVVGRVGHSAGPGLLHIGSMAEWLAHNASIPMAIVGGGVSLTPRTFLVAVDGSEGSLAAVSWVADIARSLDLNILAASVVEHQIDWTPSTRLEGWKHPLEEQIRDEFAAELTESGVALRALALRGTNPADTLLQAASEELAEVIVVGTRGLGGFLGLRVGGVALKMMHRADRPIVLVPPG